MAFDKALLRRKLLEADISQVRLAELVEVTPRTVNRWLRGDKPPKASLIKRLAEELHCRPEDFDPRYVDGENEIRVEGRVSAASHNAYATMKLVYGVDEQTIIELAPVLFSIVAARAINLTSEDDAQWAKIERKAESLGHKRLDRFHSAEEVESLQFDEKAARNNQCFGIKAGGESYVMPRNLFIEAMRRMARKAGSEVGMDQFDVAEAGEVPTARGFVPHVALFDFIAEGDAEIVRNLARGDVRLSQSMTRAKLNAHDNLEEKAEIIRKDLADQAASRRAKLAARREQGLVELSEWRAFYAERHPDLAREYDDLIAAYCKPEGWYPDHYSDLGREEANANPFAEIRFIDEELLPGRQAAEEKGELWFSFNAPETERFRELEKHRRLSKAEFREGSQ